jgi:AcrR family transcriptional regulator
MRPRQAARRKALFEAAASEINRCGAGAINLHRLAEKVGLSRNALYYYVSDRADLAFHCYFSACQAAADDLAIAYDSGRDAAERIANFIDRSLIGHSGPAVVLNDVDFLDDPRRDVIRRLEKACVDGLAAIIDDGIATGQFRCVSVRTATQALLGMLSWVRLMPDWLGHKDNAAFRNRIRLALNDMFFRGIAKDHEQDFICNLDVQRLTQRTFNPFDPQQAAEQKAEQLLIAASRLFNRRGINGTSVDDISNSVGATKGAVYHYFDDRNHLVTRCYERAFGIYAQLLDVAEAVQGTGMARALTSFHLNCQAQIGPSPPMILQPGLLGLAEPARQDFVIKAQLLWRKSHLLLQSGVDDGSCRAIDVPTFAELSAGAFMWLPKWWADCADENSIADDMTSLLQFGLLAEPT